MRRIALVALLIAFLGASGAALFFFFHSRAARIEELDPVLASVDSALAGGYLDTAREALERLAVLPSSEEALLRLLKRAHAVSNATGDFRLFADLGKRALAVNGRSPRLRAVAAYACLRSGRVAEAEGIVARGRLPADGGDLLKGETLLRRGRPWAGSDGLTHDLLSLERRREPRVFVEAALRTGDSRLSLDAALLAMQEGDRAQALQIVRRDLGDAAFDEPAAAIAYDAGDLPGALARLTRLDAGRPDRAEIILRLADCLQALGRSADAERALARALPIAPQLSWTPYANLGYLAATRGDEALADRRLEDGLAFFPRSRELRIARARIALRAGNTEAASAILGAMLADRPDDGEAALLLLDIQAAELSPERYRARLWKLFNRIPDDPATFTLLTTALIGARDWDGAGIAVRQHEAAGGDGDSGELLLIQGMIAAMKGDDAVAAAAFRSAEETVRDGRARYDMALLLVKKGNARAAIQELGIAADEYAARGNPAQRDKVLSRIETLIGSARLIEGDETGAHGALARALALDPGNLRAGLLLRKLEAGGQ